MSANVKPTRSPPHKVGFVILQEFSHLGLASAIEPLFIANWLLQLERYEWIIASIDGKAVRASNKMLVPVEGNLSAIDKCQTIFILASFEPLRYTRDSKLRAWLKRRAAAGVELIGIENGSLALAFAGLLEDHTTAVHWDNLSGFRELFPTLRARNQLYAISPGRMTCAGASAILDLMLVWLTRSIGDEISREVGKHLLLSGIREPVPLSRVARSTDRVDSLVERARELMRTCLDSPIPAATLAERLHISQRQLQRRFKRMLGHSLHRENELLRMEQAHQILQQTNMSVTEVSIACGYGSAAHFARVYRRTFRRAPNADRSQSTNAPVFKRP